MTLDEAVRARAVFLAALRESDPHSPIPEHVAWVMPGAEDGHWDVRFYMELIQRPAEEVYRAATLSVSAVGRPIGCFTCWNTNDGPRARACMKGDCHAEVSA